MAADLGVDLSTIQGSGYRGKILSDDIKAAFAQAQTAAEEENVAGAMKEIAEVLERRKLSSMRKAIMKNMNSSHTEIPNVTRRTSRLMLQSCLLFVLRSTRVKRKLRRYL